MKSYRLWILDLDGTMYKGQEKIEQAPLFIEKLKKENQHYLFLTNNSSKTPQEVVQHLALFGIDTQADKVYTTSVATADFITQHKNEPHVYMIGEKGLRVSLEQAGCHLVDEESQLASCDYVVVGIDRELTYEKLARATLAVRQGAIFIATNGDKALPTERGLLPGNGSIVSVIEQATGVKATCIGKPEALMVDLILAETKCAQSEVIMVGDNYETDIQAGIRAGVDTAIVFTGFTQKKDLQKVDVLPTYQWDSLSEAH